MNPWEEKRKDRRDIAHDVFSWRVFRWLLIAAGVFAAAAALWTAIDVFILVFAGALIAIFLRTLSDFLAARWRIGAGWSLFAVVLGLLLLASGIGWLTAPPLAEQLSELSTKIPMAFRDLKRFLELYPWGQWIVQNFRFDDIMSGEGPLGRMTGFFKLTLDSLGGLLLMVFVGLYLAADPGTYVRGLVRLLPARHRPGAEKAIGETGKTLRYWLLGQLIDMAVVGVLSFIGLTLLGIPLALILAVIAGLLNFVSYIGPFVSAIPAMLLALTKEPIYAAYVALLYLGIHLVEGYVLAPFIQKKTVHLPPALTIVSQVFLGVTVGTLGIIFAMPIMAAAMTLVKLLYLREVVGEEVHLPGHERPEPPPGKPAGPGPPAIPPIEPSD
jgi:predicted PurR-regulated permease PerM